MAVDDARQENDNKWSILYVCAVALYYYLNVNRQEKCLGDYVCVCVYVFQNINSI